MASNRTANGRFKKGTHWRKRQPFWSKAWLKREYVDHKRSAADIAADHSCGATNILHWLHKHRIRIRSISETRKVKYWGSSGPANPMYGRCGSANPHWLGGISPERQRLYARSMWKAIRLAVLERDHFRCHRCGTAPRGWRQLQTHHPKTWAEYASQRFNPDNILTMCRQCHEWIHSRKNHKREYLEAG